MSPVTDLWDLIAVERTRAADFVEALADDQLDVPSLCGQWRVRDVAGHLTMPFSVSVPRLLLGIVTSGGFDAYNAKAARELGRTEVWELGETLRRHARTRFTPPGAGPGAPLADLCIHLRDMARPLGLPATASDDAWRAVLEFLVSAQAHRGFVPKQRLAGLRLVATDLGWSHGDGAEVAGPAEAVALALAGRRAALDDLAGDGLTVLRGRLG